MASATAPTTPNTPGRRRLPQLAVIGAVALLVIAGVVAWLLLRDGSSDRGSGPVRSDVRESVGWPQPAGKAFGFGLPVVHNTGKDVAVLERIRIVGPPPGLEVIETGIGGSKRRVTWSTSREWPSTSHFRDLHPVAGYRLRPRAPGGAQLVFALRASKPGRYVFTAITVEYRIGDKRYQSQVRNGLRVCAFPAGTRRPDCPPPRNL